MSTNDPLMMGIGRAPMIKSHVGEMEVAEVAGVANYVISGPTIETHDTWISALVVEGAIGVVNWTEVDGTEQLRLTDDVIPMMLEFVTAVAAHAGVKPLTEEQLRSVYATPVSPEQIQAAMSAALRGDR